MISVTNIYDPVLTFMKDFYIAERNGKFLADVDFSFNATRKICESIVDISEKNNEDHILSISIINDTCDPNAFPLYFDGKSNEEYTYIEYSSLIIQGVHKNPFIGKFKVTITPRETTW